MSEKDSESEMEKDSDSEFTMGPENCPTCGVSMSLDFDTACSQQYEIWIKENKAKLLQLPKFSEHWKMLNEVINKAEEMEHVDPCDDCCCGGCGSRKPRDQWDGDFFVCC